MIRVLKKSSSVASFMVFTPPSLAVGNHGAVFHKGPRNFLKVIGRHGVAESRFFVSLHVKKPIGADCAGSDYFSADSAGLLRDLIDVVDGRIGGMVGVELFGFPMLIQKFTKEADIPGKHGFALLKADFFDDFQIVDLRHFFTRENKPLITESFCGGFWSYGSRA